MADCLADGRQLRLLKVPDDFNGEGLGIEDVSLPFERGLRSLNQIIGKTVHWTVSRPSSTSNGVADPGLYGRQWPGIHPFNADGPAR
ncbi:hypothetical protein SAMN04488021_10624 [Paracoccus aminovorans]|uniref:Uncharacterized protein n=1 Tax=Paracoccus aminovorans TaxID=34004 RepID=A0A1I2YV90_9RHOB|nr:transposase [Paracoccus aminovorans]SFH29583.1 hypothetical protein SAMN04488021_10624 [Paracoccus aminovorans]